METASLSTMKVVHPESRWPLMSEDLTVLLQMGQRTMAWSWGNVSELGEREQVECEDVWVGVCMHVSAEASTEKGIYS